MVFQTKEEEREYHRQWEIKNKEKRKQQRKKYREINLLKMREYQQNYREQNREQINAYAREWQNKHRNENLESQRKWRESNPDYRHSYYLKNEKDRNRICVNCGNKIPDELQRKYRKYGKICNVCYKEKKLVYLRERAKWNKEFYKIHIRLKKEAIIGYYSNGEFVCGCCGLAEDVDFLAIDHLNNNGNEHRRTEGFSSLYDWLIRNNMPEGFQVLCHNCNMAKKMNGGICPHKQTEEIIS